jgi:hypothetical protein
MSEIHNLKEERFIFVHGFSSGLRYFGAQDEAEYHGGKLMVHPMVARKQRERRGQGPFPNDLLPPARLSS